MPRRRGGGFSCSDISGDPREIRDVALGFVDGDRNLDCVFSSGGQDLNRVCLGDGSGGFSCSDVSDDRHNSYHVALGFVDGDANLDVVFSNYRAQSRVCLGDGNGNFTCSNVSNDGFLRGLALGHVDDDANLDIVFAVTGSPNRVCLGNGDGGFLCSDSFGDSTQAIAVALGDINSKPIFADGFESGDTSVWSVTVP